MATRQIKLNAFMRPASIHTGAWRYPGAWPDMNFNFAHIKQSIQKLGPRSSTPSSWPTTWPCSTCRWMRSSAATPSTSFEPFTLLSALSQATAHIGLVATGSTTFDAPYHIARRFASLDHISDGRAGWNIVTTSNPDAALNFGLDEHMEHGERYRRAREFYDVVTGLWDSLGGRRLHPRRRKRHLLRSRQDARAQPQGRISSRCEARSTSRARCRAGR